MPIDIITEEVKGLFVPHSVKASFTLPYDVWLRFKQSAAFAMLIDYLKNV